MSRPTSKRYKCTECNTLLTFTAGQCARPRPLQCYCCGSYQLDEIPVRHWQKKGDDEHDLIKEKLMQLQVAGKI